MIIYMYVLYRNMDCLQQLRAGLVFKCFLSKFQNLLEKIHRIALGLLMFVLSSSWVVCIRGPENGTGKSQWEVTMSQCVCV